MRVYIPVIASIILGLSGSFPPESSGGAWANTRSQPKLDIREVSSGMGPVETIPSCQPSTKSTAAIILAGQKQLNLPYFDKNTLQVRPPTTMPGGSARHNPGKAPLNVRPSSLGRADTVGNLGNNVRVPPAPSQSGRRLQSPGSSLNVLPQARRTKRKKHVDWCLKRYRSYRPRTDTFRGYDGKDHRCISPYS